MMYGNSAPLMNRKMSHELTMSNEQLTMNYTDDCSGGKTLKATIGVNAAPPPTRGGKTLTRSVCKTRWRVEKHGGANI
jgi:hypothetical protein